MNRLIIKNIIKYLKIKSIKKIMFSHASKNKRKFIKSKFYNNQITLKFIISSNRS